MAQHAIPAPSRTTAEAVRARLDDLDKRIGRAYRDLLVARSAFEICPTGEALTGTERAETALNALLEERHVLGRQP